MNPAPFIDPDNGHKIHWIAGHWDGAWQHGHWNALCGRIVPGFLVPPAALDDDPICKRCAAKADRIGLAASLKAHAG